MRNMQYNRPEFYGGVWGGCGP
ncbi:hypothetical protein EMIT0P100_20251 [Pseudomonas sp. IT-P100]